MESKTLKIHVGTNTDDIKYLSRIGAIVCTYSRHNPLHVFLEDGNFHEDLSSEIQ